MSNEKYIYNPFQQAEWFCLWPKILQVLKICHIIILNHNGTIFIELTVIRRPLTNYDLL